MKLPVFTGKIDTRTPDHLEGDNANFLTVAERAGLHRIHRGFSLVGWNDRPFLPIGHGVAARRVFSLIAEEFERQVST